jgi:ribonuclease VapC
MSVLDGSALAALALGRPEAGKLAAQLEGARNRVTHPLALYSAVAAVARETGRPIDAAYGELAALMAAAEIELVPVGQPETITALEAFARYGTGGRQPAQLNMEECFSYALAKLQGAELVYAGDAFADTDLVRY